MEKYVTAFLLCLSLASALLLEACNGEGISSAERIISSGWADVSNEDSEDQEPLYCYKTIGAVDCYKTPDPRRKGQLVATYPQPNTAKPVGLGKVFKSFTQEKVDQNAINEEQLDKVRYSPTAPEMAAQRARDASESTMVAGYDSRKPLNIK